jgi:hypothetical protein
MERRIAAGESIAAAARHFSRLWNQKPQCDGFPFRASKNTVRRAYERWLREGGKVEALEPRYRPRPAKIPESFVTAFLRAARKSESFQASWRQLSERKKSLPCSPRSLIRRLGPRFEPVRALFRVRVKTRRVEKKLLNRIETTLRPPKIAQDDFRGIRVAKARSGRFSTEPNESSRASRACSHPSK